MSNPVKDKIYRAGGAAYSKRIKRVWPPILLSLAWIFGAVVYGLEDYSGTLETVMASADAGLLVILTWLVHMDMAMLERAEAKYAHAMAALEPHLEAVPDLDDHAPEDEK